MKNISKAHQSKSNKVCATLLTVALISSTFASTQAMAEEVVLSQVNATEIKGNLKEGADQREHIGFGVGMVIGAIVAGPFGAFFTGIAGNLIAKHINTQEEADEFEIALSKQGEQYSNAQKKFENKLQQSEMDYQAELIALENTYQSAEQIKAEQLLMSLQFSTGSSEIAPHYQEQVAVLAQLLNSDPNLKVDLSGYTDLQGEELRNDQLSKARVESVKRLLLAQGVDESKIETFAFGQSAPLMANEQNKVSFYDRRVVMEVKNRTQTAKN